MHFCKDSRGCTDKGSWLKPLNAAKSGATHSLGACCFWTAASQLCKHQRLSHSPVHQGLVLAFTLLDLLLHKGQSFCKKLVLPKENKEDKSWETLSGSDQPSPIPTCRADFPGLWYQSGLDV